MWEHLSKQMSFLWFFKLHVLNNSDKQSNLQRLQLISHSSFPHKEKTREWEKVLWRFPWIRWKITGLCLLFQPETQFNTEPTEIKRINSLIYSIVLDLFWTLTVWSDFGKNCIHMKLLRFSLRHSVWEELPWVLRFYCLCLHHLLY